MWLPNAAATLDILGPGSLVIGVDTTPQNLVEVELDDGTTPGKVHRLTRGNSADRQPVFSSDGQWMLFSSNRGGNLDLWMMSMETGAIRRVTEDEADDWDPAFTPDGKGILWSSNRSGAFEIWTCATDGTAARQVTQDGLDAENPTATPDGRWVVYNSANPEAPGIWRIHPDGTGAERIVPGSWSVPDVSPDGRYVAFRTGGSQRSLLVARLEDGAIVAGPWELPGQITNGRARWMPDGKRLLFSGSDPSGAMGIYIQDFEPGRDTRATRRPLIGFDEDLIPESFTVSPDGALLIYSGSDTQQTLMLAEGLEGIAPARRR
jgi:Tol biopolymer transport system component